MKPVDQEFVHLPEQGQYGDCQRAVIASLMELPIAEVPHFLALSENDVEDYWDRLQAFCRARGFAYLTMPSRSGALFFGEAGDVYHEISGPSPRGNGVFHAVVGCNGQVVFDPHPTRAGLAGDPESWEYSYLVVASPAAIKATGLPRQISSIVGLGKLNELTNTNVDQNIPAFAAGAQKETSVAVDFGHGSPEHHLKAAAPAFPHSYSPKDQS